MEPGTVVIVKESHRRKYAQSPLPIDEPLQVAEPGQFQEPHEVAIRFRGQLWYVAIEDVEAVVL